MSVLVRCAPIVYSTYRSTTRRAGNGRCQIYVKWESANGGCAAGDAVIVGVARHPGNDRDQVRMRHVAQRRLHGTRQRATRALLRDAELQYRQQERDHERRLVAGPLQPDPAGVDRRRCPAVRILPVGADHDGGSAAGQDGQPDRRRYRRGHAQQYLPLRNLSIHPARGPSGRGTPFQGRCAMNALQHFSRRGFLRASAATAGGILIGFQLGSQESSSPASAKLNAFVHVGTDDLVTLFIHKAEMGQGTVTSLSMLLAEDLECDWKKVRTEFPGVNREYGGMQGVFGSASVRTSYDSLRKAVAAAPDMLVQAAARQWGTDPAKCRAENSTVVNTATNARLSYGSLADAASKLSPPANPALKGAAQFRLLGKPLPRLDTPPKVDGSAQFGIDMRLPGMQYA